MTDSTKGQEKVIGNIPNLDTYGENGPFWGRQIKTSLGNTLRTLSPLIILDEGHKAYSEGAQDTLRGFNPCMIAELSVTPSKDSNILIDVSGKELHREEMIKLDLPIVNKVNPDWKDALLAGVNKLSVLEKWDHKMVADNFVYIIEELRRQLELEQDRLAESVFRQMINSDQLRFLVIGREFGFRFPQSIAIKPNSRTLNRKDGQQLQLSLFEFVPEDEFNETEKAVAWYLEGHQRLFFWYRNRSRYDYFLQGWRKHKIYPDFIFTSTSLKNEADYEQAYGVETKGLHLLGSTDTNYKREMFSICTDEAKSRRWNELAPEIKNKVLRFEVLAEDEWEAKLNEML